MRIFYFLTTSDQGGAQSVVYELLRAHKARGDSATVMAGNTGWLARETQTLGFSYIENPFMQKTYNPFTLLGAARVYRRAVRAAQPQVVSCHSSFSGTVGRIFRIRGIPVIYTAHGWGFSYGKKGMKAFNVFVERIASYFCRRIICVSQSDKRLALKHRIAPEKKITVIYNGVDAGSRSAATGSEKKIMAFLGRFDWPKRQDILVDAYRALPEHLRQQSQILFIGSGPNEALIQKKTTVLGIEEAIRFAGALSREKALDMLAQCQLAILVSESEGFPMSVIEALALGLPVIANNVGGIDEVIDDTVGALLPKNPDTVALAESLALLLSDDQRRQSCAAQAKERGSRFSADRMARETFSLYESIS